MLGHGGSSAGSYLADPTSPIPSHCAVIILIIPLVYTHTVTYKPMHYDSSNGYILLEDLLVTIINNLNHESESESVAIALLYSLRNNPD